MTDVRKPCVAGHFYEAEPAEARAHLERCVDEAARDPGPKPEGHVIGGVVPHAGWVFSGGTAARVFLSIKAQRTPDTFVLLGADHRGATRKPTSYPGGGWLTPLGIAKIDE